MSLPEDNSTKKNEKLAKAMVGNTNSVGNKGGGRKSDYLPKYTKQATKLALLGATDVDLANFFEVSPTTILRWKKAHPEFQAALKKGKEEADAAVAVSLFRRATGYKQKTTKIVQHRGEHQLIEVVERHLPDPTSMIFWLKNRKQGLWRDRHHVTVEDPDKVLAEVLGVSKEELPE